MDGIWCSYHSHFIRSYFGNHIMGENSEKKSISGQLFMAEEDYALVLLIRRGLGLNLICLSGTIW